MSPSLFRTLRQYSGLSQAELAIQLGVTQAAVSLYETGQSTISREVALKLVRYLNGHSAIQLGEDIGTLLEAVGKVADVGVLPNVSVDELISIAGYVRDLFGWSHHTNPDFTREQHAQYVGVMIDEQQSQAKEGN